MADGVGALLLLPFFFVCEEEQRPLSKLKVELMSNFVVKWFDEGRLILGHKFVDMRGEQRATVDGIRCRRFDEHPHIKQNPTVRCTANHSS